MNFEQLLNLVQTGRINVTCDSRSVRPGDVFVAVQGTRHDGHDFIQQAVNAKAGYIVSQKQVNTSAKLIIVNDTAAALGVLAQACQSWPAKKLFNLAVTGTNGKTTVGFLVKSIIESAKEKCGLIGTVVNHTGTEVYSSSMTTPGSVEIAVMQRQMVNSGVKYMMIEASSHALHQRRLAGIEFKAAAFTNLTGDHLDYHQTMENYFDAKSKLFTALNSDGFAILNAQSEYSKKMASACQSEKLYYAINQQADIYADNIEFSHEYTKYDLHLDDKTIKIISPLLGRHNISNHLAAAGLALAVDFEIQDIKKGLETATVPGRLEPVKCSQDFAVLIDYAHTDDALNNVLKTLASIKTSNLIVVFGCGGDRDKTKRPRMAAVAQKYADKIFVTNDNPRTENPDAIIDDIMAGFSDTDNVTIQPDRAAAIELAINSAQKNDIVLIAGKGHEDYQIIGSQRTHFSDKETAIEVLSR